MLLLGIVIAVLSLAAASNLFATLVSPVIIMVDSLPAPTLLFDAAGSLSQVTSNEYFKNIYHNNSDTGAEGRKDGIKIVYHFMLVLEGSLFCILSML